MEIYFQCPVKWCGYIAQEIEHLAVLSGRPDDPNIEALYAFEQYGGKRFEVVRGTPEFMIAAHYLLSNPQERERIEDEWPADERPRASVVSEHSTMWGGP